jgi:hypothetical protein
MRFSARNVRNLCRSGSLTAAARELARCKLDSVGVQEVTRDKWGTVGARDYIFLCGKVNECYRLGTRFCTPQNGVSS